MASTRALTMHDGSGTDAFKPIPWDVWGARQDGQPRAAILLDQVDDPALIARIAAAEDDEVDEDDEDLDDEDEDDEDDEDEVDEDEEDGDVGDDDDDDEDEDDDDDAAEDEGGTSALPACGTPS
jgi:hypothetical protein